MFRMARSSVHLWLVVVAVAVTLGGPADVSAQNTEDLIESFDDSTSQEAGEGLPAASVARVNLDLNLRHWRQSLAEGAPDADPLEQLVADAQGFGFRNAPAYAAAVHTSLEEHGGDLEAERVGGIFDAAQSLAPDLPYPHLIEARYLASHHPDQLEQMVGTYVDGLSQALRWPTTRTILESYGLLAIVVFLAAGFGVVFVGQTIRHLPLAAHDFARRLPEALSRRQVLAAFVLAVIAAVLWTKSYLVGLLALVGLASLTQDWRERLVAVAGALCVAPLPFVEAQIERRAGYLDSDTRQVLEAQYLRCGEGCRDRLAGELETREQSFPTRYALALASIKTGDRGAVERALELLETPASTPEAVRGHVHNLRGAALFTSGQTEAAIEAFQTATAQMAETASVAAWFNLMRASRRAGRDEMASRASSEASERDAERVQRKAELTRDDPASYLMLPPLPTTYLWQQYRQAPSDAAETSGPAGTVISRVWRRAAGPSHPFADTPLFGIGTAAGLLLLSILSLLGFTSSPCPNCGLAREPDDPERTGGHPHCLPCYRTFVGGAELGYRARVHYETLLGRRSTIQMFLRRALSLLVPGAGHALAGRVFAGFALGGTLGLGLLLVAQPDWLWQPARSIAGPDFLGLRWLGGLLVVGVVGAAVASAYRDIEPVVPSSNLDGREEHRG